MESYLQVQTNYNGDVALMQSLSDIDSIMIHARGLPEKRLNTAYCVRIITFTFVTFKRDCMLNLRKIHNEAFDLLHLRTV